MTDSIRFLADGYKALLPSDYTTMAANRIKLFANFDKMRILEFLRSCTILYTAKNSQNW